MLIKSVKYVDSLQPNGCSSTGYSEPDRFHVTCDNGVEKDVWIDIWYLPEESVKDAFIKGINVIFQDVTNIDEAFEMYKSALIPTKSCPHFWMGER